MKMTASVFVRVTPEEKQEMQKVAQRIGFPSVSALIRAMWREPSRWCPEVERVRKGLKEQK